MNAPPASVGFREAIAVWWKIGWLSFGGPAGQIALMHRVLVEEKRWIDETRFLHALNYCMLLPGPEAQQLATYVGWLLHGTRGGLIAGSLFILPGLAAMVLISIAYVLLGQTSWMEGLLYGMQAATLAIVIEAVQRVARRALKHKLLYLLAAAAFVALFAFAVPFPLVIAAAAVLGILGARWVPAAFAAAPAKGTAAMADRAPQSAPAWQRSARTLLIGLSLWWGPVLLLFLLLGAHHVYTQEALFFSKMAVVTFGGAYAVLAYMAQQAVAHYGWLGPQEMIRGLALAETTPGPLILVLSYVGFLGAWRDPGALPPIAAGVLGALVSTWVSFAPCFLWIFLGAPYIERLRGNQPLNAALTGITAAVVGVILNLSIWFALHVLFGEPGHWSGYGLQLPLPDWSRLDWVALGLGAAAMIALLRFHVPLLAVLGASGALGMLWRVLG